MLDNVTWIFQQFLLLKFGYFIILYWSLRVLHHFLYLNFFITIFYLFFIIKLFKWKWEQKTVLTTFSRAYITQCIGLIKLSLSILNQLKSCIFIIISIQALQYLRLLNYFNIFVIKASNSKYQICLIYMYKAFSRY